jgi:malonyl-CoA O-methyltransferase
MHGSLHPAIDARAAMRWACLPVDGKAPWLHEEVARRMAARLPLIRLPVRHWADWSPRRGGAQGRALVAQHYAGAPCTLVDAATPRPQPPAANALARWWPGARARAGVPSPLAPAQVRADSLDLIWANMLLHQVPEPGALLAQWARALRENGFVMFSTLGPDTLRNLRALYARHGWGAPAQPFADMHDWGDMLVASGFADPVMDMEPITLTFDSPERLLLELRGLGRNLHAARFAALRGRQWHATLCRAARAELCDATDPGRLALNFEIIYGHALKPAPRMAVRPQTTISLAGMRQALSRGR